MNKKVIISLVAAAAGAVNGLFGAGGGMILVPLLTSLVQIDEDIVFPTSVSIILPICIVSLIIGSNGAAIPIREALPYMLGAIGGGIAAGLTQNKIPVKWLHRILGIFIIWGGVRYLC